MSTITYQNIPIRINYPDLLYYPVVDVPATNLSIQYQNKLEESRLLGAIQPNGLRIGGGIGANISMTFPVDFISGGSNAYLLLDPYTGDSNLTLTVGGTVFSGCYLNNVAVTVQPLTPAILTADFTCLNMKTGSKFISGVSTSVLSNNLTSGFIYGHNAIINGGSSDNLTDPSKQQITYKVSCARTPVYEIGQQLASKMFLDHVTKEMSIKSTNVGSLINQYGTGEAFSINLIGEPTYVPNIFGSGTYLNSLITLSISSAAKITDQKLTISDGGILDGEVTLKEVIR